MYHYFFTFPESLQSNQSEDLFGKSAQDHTHIKLNLSTSDIERDTDIIYRDGATLSWANVLYATVFGGANQNFSIYIELIADSEIGKLIIYDVTGRLVLQSSFFGNGNNTMQLPHLKRGMYLVKVHVNEGIISKKLMLD